MGEFRCSAASIIGIASVNTAVYRTVSDEPGDEIIIIVPEGMPGRAAVVPTDEGDVLLIQGKSANISGGLNLQLGTVHGQMSADIANQMIQIKVPAGRDPRAINWSGPVPDLG
ncbi:MAG TPA: hypothetical protein VFT59_02295 [Candidatus Saccharimonadales bacterium]|nr:hypothetical protein [Candidatus Saccharimonadales bacterium]